MSRARGALRAVVVVGATAALIFELRPAPVEVHPPVPIRVGPAKPQPYVESDSDRAVLLAAILARPLFSPSRRPTDAVASAGPGFEMPRLAGIIVSPAERRAIFAAADKAKPVVVTEGSALGEWSVRLIANDEVTLASPSGIRVLHPGFQKRYSEPSYQAASPLPGTAQAVWPGDR